MKWIFLIVAVIVGLFAYRTHIEHLREEEDRVAFEKLDREHREKNAQREAESRRRALTITKIVDPLYVTVAGPLDTTRPLDFVPQLEITKQRILDKQPRSEPLRQAAYDRAGAVFDALIGLAEERTRIVEEMVRNKNKTSPFDQPGKPNTSAEFFNRGLAGRWGEVLGRYKPVISQRLEQLRAAERAWNATLSQYPGEEYYELPSLDPVVITAESTSPPTNGLNTNENPNGKVTRPWRSWYYDQNGYRYPSFSH